MSQNPSRVSFEVHNRSSCKTRAAKALKLAHTPGKKKVIGGNDDITSSGISSKGPSFRISLILAPRIGRSCQRSKPQLHSSRFVPGVACRGTSLVAPTNSTILFLPRMVVRDVSDHPHHLTPKIPKEALEATLAFIVFGERRVIGGSHEFLGRESALEFVSSRQSRMRLGLLLEL